MFAWLQRNQWVYIVLFVAAAVLLWRAVQPEQTQSNSDNVSDETWFVDVATGEPFRAGRDLVPPIKSPAGNEAAWAAMYGCGGCGKEQRFIGYYIKHTDELKAQAESDAGVKASLYGESRAGRLYSTDGKTWVAAESPDKAGMIESFRNRCGEAGIRRCP